MLNVVKLCSDITNNNNGILTKGCSNGLQKNVELKNKIMLAGFIASVVLRAIFDIILKVDRNAILILVGLSIPLAVIDFILIKRNSLFKQCIIR